MPAYFYSGLGDVDLVLFCYLRIELQVIINYFQNSTFIYVRIKFPSYINIVLLNAVLRIQKPKRRMQINGCKE
jgi:hypothetical protein